MTKFDELGLDPLLLKALETEGYTTPTPIQAQAIPSILAGRDLLGIAQTGTGKTAAFALPILHRLAAGRQPALRKGTRALILSPTRELATQIAESFRTYGRHMGLTVAVVFGGVAHKPQRDALARGVDVLVATPGRLLDHMGERNVVLDGTEILVLDEADQMMDLGFIRPLRQIVSKLSHRRQSLFFSATMPHEIGALAAELLKEPVKVSVTPVAKTADRVAQEVILIEQQKKRALLVELFARDELTRTIVFTRTKRGADRVARHLEGAGIRVAAIHGNKSQAQRDAAMNGFKSGKIRALIATDIAARGIDVDAVSHVINYEIPNVPESYVHRIGRTARAGAEGIAISLVDDEERAYLRDIERLTRLQIACTDRRNDATLVVAAEGRGELREPREPGRHRHGDTRGQGAARGAGHREARRDGPAAAKGNPGRRHDERGDRAGGERSLHDRGGERRHGADRHNAARTRADRTGTDRRGADRNGAERNGADRPARDRHGHDRPTHDRNGKDRRAHGSELRPRHPGAHRDGEARSADHPAQGHRSGATGKGLEGVKFLSQGVKRPGTRPHGPHPDDRRKAPTRST